MELSITSKTVTVYTLTDGRGSVLATMESTRSGDVMIIHNSLHVRSHKVLIEMKAIFERCCLEWSKEGITRCVAMIDARHMDEKLRRFRSYFGFTQETEQHGYNCAVREV